MNHNEYNGWYNYETWLIKLWMDNDGEIDGLIEDAQALFENAKADKVFSKSERARLNFAESLKNYKEEQIDEKNIEGWVGDLVSGALSEVNWQEIADNILRDAVTDYEPCICLVKLNNT